MRLCIFLETSPAGNMNVTTQGVVTGVPVLFTCEVKFTGSLSPKMNWTDELGREVENTVINSNSSYLKTGIIAMEIGSILRSFSCVTYFDAPPERPPSQFESATNAPSYTSNWASPIVQTVFGKHTFSALK